MTQKLAETTPIALVEKRSKKRVRVYLDPHPLPFRRRARVFLHVNRRPLVTILIVMSWLICAGLVFVFRSG